MWLDNSELVECWMVEIVKDWSDLYLPRWESVWGKNKPVEGMTRRMESEKASWLGVDKILRKNGG